MADHPVMDEQEGVRTTPAPAALHHRPRGPSPTGHLAGDPLIRIATGGSCVPLTLTYQPQAGSGPRSLCDRRELWPRGRALGGPRKGIPLRKG